MKRHLALMLAIFLTLSFVLTACGSDGEKISSAIEQTSSLLNYTTTSNITVESDFKFASLNNVDVGFAKAVNRFLSGESTVTVKSQCDATYSVGTSLYTLVMDPGQRDEISFSFYISYDFSSPEDLKLSVIIPVPKFLNNYHLLTSKGTNFFVIDLNADEKLKEIMPIIASLQKRNHILSSTFPFVSMLAELKWESTGSTYTLSLNDKTFKNAILAILELVLSDDDAALILKTLQTSSSADLEDTTKVKEILAEKLSPFMQSTLVSGEGITFTYELEGNNPIPLLDQNNGFVKTQTTKITIPISQPGGTRTETSPQIKMTIATNFTNRNSTEVLNLPTTEGQTAPFNDTFNVGYKNLFNAIIKDSDPTPKSTVTLSGVNLKFEKDDTPIRVENTEIIMVPARLFLEKLGYSVTGAVKNGVSTITAQRGTQTVVVFANSDKATVNDAEHAMEQSAFIHADRTMVPLSFICSVASMDYEFTSTEGTTSIVITEKNKL